MTTVPNKSAHPNAAPTILSDDGEFLTIEGPHHGDHDYLPWGQLNQCVATTKRGHRCLNPVWPADSYFSYLGEPSGVAILVVLKADLERQLDGLCWTHQVRA